VVDDFEVDAGLTLRVSRVQRLPLEREHAIEVPPNHREAGHGQTLRTVSLSQY